LNRATKYATLLVVLAILSPLLLIGFLSQTTEQNSVFEGQLIAIDLQSDGNTWTIYRGIGMNDSVAFFNVDLSLYTNPSILVINQMYVLNFREDFQTTHNGWVGTFSNVEAFPKIQQDTLKSVTFVFQNDYGNYQACTQYPYFGAVIETYLVNIGGSFSVVSPPIYSTNQTYELDLYSFSGELLCGCSFHGGDIIQVRQSDGYYFVRNGVDLRY
jgi:hypothetical protein